MIKVGIVGVTGMAGGEALKILLKHPDVELTYLGSEHGAGSEIGQLLSSLKGICRMKCEKIDADLMLKKADVFFLCKESGFGMGIAEKLLKAGKKVIDLGPDFRIQDVSIFEKYYKINHTAKELISEAVYGLPELYRKKIEKASLVANPGCYPTGAILAVAPLLQVLESQSFGVSEFIVSVSAYSGLSGSGKKYSESTKNLFIEAYGNLRPYNVGKHRHLPEMEQVLSDVSGKKIKVSFVPHTAPIYRGILSTIFLPGCGKKYSKVENLIETYKKFYNNEPFMRILDIGESAQTQMVIHSNICEISLHPIEETGQIVVISAIDNLVKGAAGQAVQNMNIMCGLDETAGLYLRSI